MQKNQEYIVTIENLGANGEGVALLDNLPVFVPFALPHEKVKIHILKVLKNFAYAKLVQVIEPAKERVEPVCKVFTKCGGCQLQHLKYSNQLDFKTNLVKTNLKKFAGIDFDVQPCVPSPVCYKYRNKLQMPIGEIDGKIVMGLYAPNSHRIVPTNSCPLQDDWCTKLICIVLKYAEISGDSGYSTMQTGNLRHLVSRFVDGKLVVVIVTTSGKLKSSQTLIDLLKQEFDDFSLFVNKNNSNTNVILGEKFTLLYGDSEQQIDNFGIKYKVSPQSFLQVNTLVQNLIYQSVLDEIDQSEVIVDAYSGAGLLSAIVSRKAKQVYGIEIVPNATKNADSLARENNIKNMTNICGDCAVELPKLVEKLDGQNLSIILDPPRKGCDQKVINSLIKVLPQKILYVSCNSATLARDLKPLLEFYDINKVTPFDMFPQTSHVETFVSLTLKK